MVYIRLIYVYSVISVIDKRLHGNTKKWTLVRSWLIGVPLVHSWAGSFNTSIWETYILCATRERYILCEVFQHIYWGDISISLLR